MIHCGLKVIENFYQNIKIDKECINDKTELSANVILYGRLNNYKYMTVEEAFILV